MLFVLQDKPMMDSFTLAHGLPLTSTFQANLLLFSGYVYQDGALVGFSSCCIVAMM